MANRLYDADKVLRRFSKDIIPQDILDYLNRYKKDDVAPFVRCLLKDRTTLVDNRGNKFSSIQIIFEQSGPDRFFAPITMYIMDKQSPIAVEFADPNSRLQQDKLKQLEERINALFNNK